MKIPITELTQPFYEGSVQRLFSVAENDAVMVTQTTARGSVFDVGALFEIPGHDVNRAVFRHVLYSRLGRAEIWKKVAESIRQATELDSAYRDELLSGSLEEYREKGASTHHEGMLDALSGEVVREGLPENPSTFNVVRKYQILKPARCEFLGAHLFDYSGFTHEDGFVVPLEYIVRFGITSASSVFRKYQTLDERARKAFEKELGVSKALQAWQYLEKPISDFTSKFEPEDRMVSKQEALVMSCLDGDEFVKSGKLAVLGAWAVRQLLEEIGLLLWDIKWEFAKDDRDIVFVDTIDTDSFRATAFIEADGEKFVTHYNKQAIRDYFSLLHGDWIQAIAETKGKGQSDGIDFTEILRAGQEKGIYPATPEVDAEFIAIQERKMALIRDYMLGSEAPEAVRDGLQIAGQKEIEFYRAAGKLDGFRSINGV